MEVVRHPAKTKAQRRVLDAIGCGNYSPQMNNRTLEAMLTHGLIDIGKGKLVHDRDGFQLVPTYEMPPRVHYQWRQYQNKESG